MHGVNYLDNCVAVTKRDIDKIHKSSKDICTIQNMCEKYIDNIINNNNIMSQEAYFELSYICADRFYEAFKIKNSKDRLYYQKYFSDMAEFFCNKYIEIKGEDAFNKTDIDFLIEMTMLFDLADKHDERFDLLDSIIKNTKNNACKLRAVIQILNTGDLNSNLLIDYQKMKSDITGMYKKDKYICPVCGFDNLEEPAYYKCSQDIVGSYNGCPCCGFYFSDIGNINLTELHTKYRKEWIENGCNFINKSKMPKDWDPNNQLKNLSSKNPKY